ncbi:uncharacterized protein LOC130897921 [Diorhabda carinulata]|uniref:uncharacterized protein LOC130897921 n=1 Tax=Diorhabda carinulata TaxID=1163345 RepID=UPI0025A00937|nr:uncharacterized protein LOC130897921 [Diorhabda carinulata]
MLKIPFSLMLFMLCSHSNCAQGLATKKNVYATILQDARNEPTPDGTFGYLYKTEDGIVSSARGGPNGVIQGGFSYTDPTGLKVNINYNAGSRTSPTAVEPSSKSAYSTPSVPVSSRYRSNLRTTPSSMYNEPRYYNGPSQEYDQYQEQEYLEQEPRYVPRPRAQPIYRTPQYTYQRRNRPNNNEIYDDYNYRN